MYPLKPEIEEIGGEPLEVSGFQDEEPEPEFEPDERLAEADLRR